MPEFTYKPYNKNTNVLQIEDGGKDHPYHNTILKLGGKWAPRLKDGPGWVVPKTSESEMLAMIKEHKKETEISNMQLHAKSGKNQSKYHRAVSSDEEEEEQVIAVVKAAKKYAKTPEPSPQTSESESEGSVKSAEDLPRFSEPSYSEKFIKSDKKKPRVAPSPHVERVKHEERSERVGREELEDYRPRVKREERVNRVERVASPYSAREVVREKPRVERSHRPEFYEQDERPREPIREPVRAVSRREEYDPDYYRPKKKYERSPSPRYNSKYDKEDIKSELSQLKYMIYNLEKKYS